MLNFRAQTFLPETRSRKNVRATVARRFVVWWFSRSFYAIKYMARVKRYIRFAARFCIPLFSVEVNRARWKLNAIISQQRGRNFAERDVAKTCQSLSQEETLVSRTRSERKKVRNDQVNSTSIGSIFRLSRYRFEKSRLKIVLKLHGIGIIVKSL